MRIVAALGGNALLERGEKPDAAIQEHHVLRAVEGLSTLCRGHDVIITHGNGPQIGVLALESDADASITRGYPLDVLGAQTQGMIGYWLLQALENAVPQRAFASLVCQTVVSSDDPALNHPSKFVGEVYTEEQAKRLAKERGWQIRQDGSGWRRVVPSPLPKELVELPAVERLVASGTCVVCAGGGGIPVVRDDNGRLRGIEAVIDKDHTAALLAEATKAEALLLLTDVPALELDFGTPSARPIGRATPSQLRRLELPAGSMGPKVEAACNFVEATGHIAAIGHLDAAAEMLAGTSGTIIHPDGHA